MSREQDESPSPRGETEADPESTPHRHRPDRDADAASVSENSVADNLAESPDNLSGAMRTRTESGTTMPRDDNDASFSIDTELGPDTNTGRKIGPYKILQVIGQGGMGTVYLAQQDSPVRRRVAVKIIKLGMDTRQVIARFEAERQALSMMDHPNIARVLDVGATDEGRPYFVMEWVKGQRVTEYCDDKRLPLADRLRLFHSICNGVHHAHQRGIIHRDLKPSNILVAEYDHDAVPKIIDFGLAKAMHERLTDKTMFTQVGQVVGTLAYMSPEQSKLNQLDVDIRTDIYSLGVILYEILTGTTPFDRSRMNSDAIDQVLKIIREEEPPKPSVRLSSFESSTDVAASRQVAPKQLPGILRGELDWIVMKAMDKDRSRRYESASRFAEDVQRYLSGQPIEAAPPSAMYRARKFVRRNRASVTAASLILLTLIVGIIGTSVGLYQANEARNAAQAAQRTAESRRKRTREALDLMSGTMLDEWLLSQSDVSDEHKRFLTQVLAYYQDFSEDSGDDVETQLLVAKAHQRIGNINKKLGEAESALDAYLQSESILRSLDPEAKDQFEFRLALSSTLTDIGLIHKSTGNRDEGLKYYQDSAELLSLLEADHPTSLEIQSRRNKQRYLIAQLLIAERKFGDAIPMLENVVATWKTLQEQHGEAAGAEISLANTLQSLALQYRNSGNQAKAIATYEEGIAGLESFLVSHPFDEDSRWLLSVLVNDLGILHKANGRYAVAEPMYVRARDIRRALFSENPNRTEYATLLGGSYLNLGNLYRILERDEQAVESYETGIQICEQVLEREAKLVRPRVFIRNMFEGLAESQILKRDFAAALKSWEQSIAHNAPVYSLNDPAFDMRLPLRRAYVLAKLNRVPTAISLTEAILDETPEPQLGEAWFCAASVYAAASEITPDESESASLAMKAMEYLRSSVEIGEAWSGPKGTDWKDDPELESLRSRPDFKDLKPPADEKEA